MQIRRVEKIIWIGLILSIILWLLTIGTTYITNFSPDTLFYAKALPAYYWYGIFINIAIFLSLLYFRINKDNFNFFLIIILVLYLFGTPCFIYSNARMLDVHYYLAYTLDLLLAGHYSDRSKMYLIDFPLATIFFYISVIILKIPPLIFAKYYPILLMALSSLFIYLTARRLSKNYALIAPITYLSIAIIQEYRLCPQSYALLLFSTFFFIIIYSHNKRSYAIDNFILIILWLCIVMAHPVTPILNLIAFILAFPIYEFIRTKTIKSPFGDNLVIEKSKSIIKLILLYFIIYIAYIVFASHLFFKEIINTLELIAKDVLYGDLIYIPSPYVTTPSISYKMIYYMRWTELIGMIVLVIIASLLIAKIKNQERVQSAYPLIALFFGYIFFSVGLIASGKSGGSYGPDRGLLFALIPCSILFCLVPELMQKGKLYRAYCGSLIIFVIVSMILIPVTQFGSDPYNFVSDSERSGMIFIEKNPESIINLYDFFIGKLGHSPFMNYWHNLFELKQLSGLDYKRSFSEQNALYDSGNCKIYFIR